MNMKKSTAVPFAGLDVLKKIDSRRKLLFMSAIVLTMSGFFVIAMVVPQEADQGNTYEMIFSLQQQVAALQAQLQDVRPPFVMPDSIKLCGHSIDFKDPFIFRRVRREINEIVFKEGELGNLADFSGEFFPVIEPILARENMPDDIKYLVAVESNFKVKAASYAGAKGPWQFIDSSARRFGLKYNSEYDERYKLSLATEAAVKHLKASYKIFGDWLLALTAYNKGDRGMNNILSIQGIDLSADDDETRSNGSGISPTDNLEGELILEDTMAEQQDSNFWDLVLLVKVVRRGRVVGYRNEQERYVPRVIAMKLILENIYTSDFLKFDTANRLKPIPSDTVTAQKTMSSMDVANAVGVSLWNLKYLNPQFKDVYPIFPAGKDFELPLGYGAVFDSAKDHIKEYRPKASKSKSSNSRSETRKAYKPGDPLPKSITLQSGETLFNISRHYDVPMKTILSLNDITYQSARYLKPGREIILREGGAD